MINKTRLLEFSVLKIIQGFPGGSEGKVSTCYVETWVVKIPWVGEGNGNPLQYSCLENPHGHRSLAGAESDRTQ